MPLSKERIHEILTIPNIEDVDDATKLELISLFIQQYFPNDTPQVESSIAVEEDILRMARKIRHLGSIWTSIKDEDIDVLQ